MQAEQMGDDRDGVTVFVPANAAFERLDPGLDSALRDGELDNELRCTLLGALVYFSTNDQYHNVSLILDDAAQQVSN